MVALIFEVWRKALASLVIVYISGKIFSELLRFGQSSFQAMVVISFYVYCFLALFSRSRYRLFHVLSIPIFTQFLHLFQKYSFAAGANSISRLLPFVLLTTYFSLVFLKLKVALSRNQKLFLLTWVATQFCFLILSPNLPNIIAGGFLFFLIVLPMYFVYLANAARAADFVPEVERSLTMIYFLLGIGTFALIVAAANYRGSDNLLATRNISDTNVTMAYFILLWPFVLLWFIRRGRSASLFFGAIAIFIGIVIFSFSRGAVFIITPYLIISAMMVSRRKQIGWMLVAGSILVTFSKDIVGSFQDHDLSYFWALRFGEIHSMVSVMEKLQTGSGRAEIHAIAYALFLESPLFGHGTGSFELLGPGYREAHSLLLTLLAEQGLTGTIYMYCIFATLGIFLIKIERVDKIPGMQLFTSLVFYLIFNHTVGSVFVIIPAKSVTINCIAPILLLCLYFYGKSLSPIPNG
jgi:O-antigen ligase